MSSHMVECVFLVVVSGVAKEEKARPTQMSFDDTMENKTRVVHTVGSHSRFRHTLRIGKARQGKARQGKARQGRTRQDRARVVALRLVYYYYYYYNNKYILSLSLSLFTYIHVYMACSPLPSPARSGLFLASGRPRRRCWHCPHRRSWTPAAGRGARATCPASGSSNVSKENKRQATRDGRLSPSPFQPRH